MFDGIKNHIAYKIFLKKFRRENSENFVFPKNMFPLDVVKIGKYTYGSIEVSSFNTSEESLTIGSYCSLANTKFMLAGEHQYKTFSTYPFKVKLLNEKVECLCKGPIIIEDDVWIGESALVLSGVTIGQGAIVAAGAVVTKDIPPYAIVGGNPAKVIKYRFDQDIINVLTEIDFNSIDKDKIVNSLDDLYKEIKSIDDAKNILRILKKDK